MGNKPSGEGGPDDVDSSRVRTKKSGKNGKPSHLQSDEAKRKLEHKLYVARESPDETFDISGCELTEVPSGVYSLCKVLNKGALLMHTNWLHSLNGGGTIKELANIRVLDLHGNDLSCLPEDVGGLRSLQVLNLERNCLKSLPASIDQLHALQTLNVRSNRLKTLPSTICNLKSLRTLDISDNAITSLPKELCQVRTLESLILTADHMTYPSIQQCTEGTEAIMKFLCSECNTEFIPPSKFTLDVLNPPTSISPAARIETTIMRERDEHLRANMLQYESKKEKKRQERIALERQLEEEQRMQAQMAAQAMHSKQHLITAIAEDQIRMKSELNTAQQKKDRERVALIKALHEVEENAAELMSQLQSTSEKAHQTEALLEQMEQERIESEQWFKVRREESEILRKQEVLDAMQRVLQEFQDFEAMRLGYSKKRDKDRQRAHRSNLDEENQIRRAMESSANKQNEFVDYLMEQEKLQRAAFEALQMEKDVKHKRLTSQIDLIEQELAQLTLVEIERQEMKLDTEKNILAEKRVALTSMLIQLMQERDIRQQELHKRVAEMEANRLNDQSDYWLVQYQRLMDRKPQSLLDEESNLELAVVSILEQAGALEYKPLFSRHRISIETLLQIADKDLKSMGVHELGLRKAILTAVDDYSVVQKKAAAKDEEIKKPFVRQDMNGASSVEPSPAQTPTEVTAHINSECVICMDRKSELIFLNCGHVCCCVPCAEPLQECPLCRGAIVQRIKLTAGCTLGDLL